MAILSCWCGLYKYERNDREEYNEETIHDIEGDENGKITCKV